MAVVFRGDETKRKLGYFQFVKHIHNLFSDCSYITIKASEGGLYNTYKTYTDDNRYRDWILLEDDEWPVSYSATGYPDSIPPTASSLEIGFSVVLKREDTGKELVINYFSDSMIMIDKTFYYTLDALDVYILKWAISENE